MRQLLVRKETRKETYSYCGRTSTSASWRAAGALSRDAKRWIAEGRRFLFPVRGLSKMFRGKYLRGLAQLIE